MFEWCAAGNIVIDYTASVGGCDAEIRRETEICRGDADAAAPMCRGSK
jgi:hypothetical protein